MSQLLIGVISRCLLWSQGPHPKTKKFCLKRSNCSFRRVQVDVAVTLEVLLLISYSMLPQPARSNSANSLKTQLHQHLWTKIIHPFSQKWLPSQIRLIILSVGTISSSVRLAVPEWSPKLFSKHLPNAGFLKHRSLEGFKGYRAGLTETVQECLKRVESLRNRLNYLCLSRKQCRTTNMWVTSLILPWIMLLLFTACLVLTIARSISSYKKQSETLLAEHQLCFRGI